MERAKLLDLIERTKADTKEIDKEYWLQLCDDIGEFFESCTDEEYEEYMENAYWDVPGMICDAINEGLL